MMETLRRTALEDHDRIVGLVLADIALDCCITKAPCDGEKAERSPVDRGKRGIKRSTVVDACGIPLGVLAAPANRHDSPLLDGTLETLKVLGPLPEKVSVHLDRGYDSESTRRKRDARGLIPVISKGQAGACSGHQAVGHRAHQLLAQRPQEALLVYRKAGASGRLLGRLLQRHHSTKANPSSLGSLPLGGPTSLQTVTYWRKLLILQ